MTLYSTTKWNSNTKHCRLWVLTEGSKQDTPKANPKQTLSACTCILVHYNDIINIVTNNDFKEPIPGNLPFMWTFTHDIIMCTITTIHIYYIWKFLSLKISRLKTKFKNTWTQSIKYKKIEYMYITHVHV